MYLMYTGGGQYANAVRRKRKSEGGGYETIYLGRVLDRERGIYESKERGVFRFDIKTGEFSESPKDFVPEPVPDSEPKPDQREKPVMTLHFAGTYFIYQFLIASGLMAVLLSIPGNNKDTMLALLMFYLTSEYADCDAHFWYRHNIAKLLFPKANLKSARISDFLASFGKQEKVYNFFVMLLKFIQENYGSNEGLLIDSTMLPNNIDISLTKTITKSDEVITGLKMAVVVQKGTGIPVFYELFKGNAIDSTIFQTILIRLKHLGVDLKSILIDCGFNTPVNLDMLYEEDGRVKISFITRVKSNDANLTQEIFNELESITDKSNLVTYKDRLFFIVKKQVKVGKNKDKTAWLYFGVDVNRQSLENLNTAKKTYKKNLDLEKVYDKLCDSGFFGLLSSDLHDVADIIPAYYERVPVEQTIDFMKNYTKLLPLEKQNGHTLRGHIFLSFIGSIIVRLVQIGLKKSKLYVGSTLRKLNESGSIMFKNAISTDPFDPEVREVYEAFDIAYPAELPIIDGKLLLRNSPHSIVQSDGTGEPTSHTPPVALSGQEPLGSSGKKPFAMKRAKTLVPDPTPTPSETSSAPTEKPLAPDVEVPVPDGTMPEPNGSPAETSPGKRPSGRPKGSRNKTQEGDQVDATNASSSTVPTGNSPSSSGGKPARSRKKKTISSPAWPKASSCIAPHEGQDGSAPPETQGT